MKGSNSHIDEVGRVRSHGWHHRFMSKWLGLIPIALIVVLTAVLAISDVHASRAPPILFPILNTLFIFSMYSIAAYFAAGTFMRTGSWQLLLFGTGILILGTSATLAAWLSSVGGLNLVAKIHNVNALVASFMILSVAALAWKSISPRKEPGRLRILITAYAAALAFIALVTVLALQGLMPTFVNASGPTMLRQTIYGTAAVILGISAFWLLRLYYRSKVDFLYWCCLGLMLITIGFTAGLFITVLSDEISWLARISLYFSGIYFIVAGLVARAEARTRGMEIHELIAEFGEQAKINYELLVNTASDAIIAVDGLGRILLWNPAAEKMFDYSQSEAIGLAFFDLIFSPKHVDSYKKAADAVGSERDNNGYSITMELKARKRNREEFPVELTLATRKRAAERLPTTMLILRDITERKQAEEALRSAEARFRLLVEQSLVGIYITQDKKIIYVNPKLAEMLGYTQDEITSSKSVADLIIEEDSDRAIENIRKRLRGEVQSIQHTFRGKRKDGTLIDLEVHGTRTELDGRTVVIGVALDITERKKAEEALKESEERLRFALETSHTGAWDLDLVDHTAHRSLEHDHIFGYEQLLPRWTYEMFLDHVLPEDRAKVDAKFREVTAACSDWGFECRIRRVDDEIRWIWAAGRHQEDATGSARRMAGIVQDITERKRAEEALARSSRRVSEILESITDGFMAIDNGWRFTYVNQRAAGNLGFKPEDLIGQNIWEKFPAIKGTDHEIYYRKTMQQHEPQHFEMHGVLTDKWYEIRVYPSAEGISVFWQDITERKRAEGELRKAHDELEARVRERTAELEEANKALLESETSYRELTESIDDLFYAMDRNLRYTYWNKASEALTDISAKDAIGKSLYELFPDIKGMKAEQFYIQALKTQKPERFESEYQLGDKKLIFEINAYPTKDGLSVIAKDITEKKMLEAQLLRAQRMESIGTLAGGIAHDLNNMLTPMMLSLQMLKEKLKDEQSQKLLTILEQNSQRSADLIKQVLSFARGIEGERNPLAARHIITEIEKVAKETFPRNIEIKTDIQRNLFTISGDATQLHQVIMNLCVNARDAMPDGGILNITASNFFIDENYSRMHTEAKIGSYVVVEVSDTGTGIPPKILDRIFEPFFTTKEFGKGTGLGLSTALAIVKSHSGFINVNSEVGRGTTFKIYLPAIKTEMQNIDEKQPELLFGHGKLVLVVEDEDSVREVTISTLEKNGYTVLTACDGVEAVSSYAQNMNEIKVILMDMMMPVMDGHAGIRAIRKINPGVKIIAVSGLAEKEKLKNVAEYTNAFLPKPYTAERLLKTIHEVLSTK